MGSAAEEEMGMATYRTKAEWNEIVEAYQKSGQTMKAFCEGRGLSPKTLGSHVKNPIKYEPVSRSMEEWIPLLEEQKASGLPMSRWCREHEISESALRAAERRRQSLQDTGPKWVELSPSVVSAENQAASAAKKEEESGKIRIRSAGLEIEVDAGYPVEKLAVLLGKLVRTC